MNGYLKSNIVTYHDNGFATEQYPEGFIWYKTTVFPCATPKPKLTTVWEGDSLDILARESVEGLTKHQPKGSSPSRRYYFRAIRPQEISDAVHAR